MAEPDEIHTTDRADYTDDPVVEMTEGYRDGSDADCPDPGWNWQIPNLRLFLNQIDYMKIVRCS